LKGELQFALDPREMLFHLTVRDQGGDMQADASEAVVGDQFICSSSREALRSAGMCVESVLQLLRIMMKSTAAIYWT
jgi:hypothetical protein